ncbi:paraneoplastic antigen Ma3-like [Gigantopelta aegis]|uniref:paraneoplastic antigen Ma3-like n=1 Tax=Gigantopelta aegis TaxID=1735272 RepID=UPI001B8893B9|nr:paraneoplastic antigen Ma3-like [Gigantopelta aegis]
MVVPVNLLIWIQGPKQSISSDIGVKAESSFDTWVYEIDCLKRDKKHSHEVITQAVKRSLKGDAAKVAMRLGSDASLSQLVHKLQSIYGSVDEGEALLGEFYSARQQDGEDVSSWGCRVEDLFYKAFKSNADQMNANHMLRTRFWGGLQQWIKDCSGHIFDKIQDFDRLRVELRRVEQNHMVSDFIGTKQTTKKPVPVKRSLLAPPPLSETEGIKKLEAMMYQLSSKFDKFETQLHDRSTRGPTPDRQPLTTPSTYKGVRTHAQSSSGRTPQRRKEIQCWKCGQVGHIAIGCRNEPLDLN